MSQNPRFFIEDTLWKLLKKWEKINDFLWWLPYESCRKMGNSPRFSYGLPYENCRKMSKNPWFFIGFTLCKMAKNQQQFKIFHRSYLMKIVEKMSKNPGFFIDITLWKLSKNEQKSVISHKCYPMKIVEKWAKFQEFL